MNLIKIINWDKWKLMTILKIMTTKISLMVRVLIKHEINEFSFVICGLLITKLSFNFNEDIFVKNVFLRLEKALHILSIMQKYVCL